eukprot:IDg4234t1
MTSKRLGPSCEDQRLQVHCSTGDRLSTNELLTVSSELYEISRRTDEKVIRERADETQQCIQSVGAQNTIEVNPTGGQLRLEEALHSTPLPQLPDPLAGFEVVSGSLHDDGSFFAASPKQTAPEVKAELSSFMVIIREATLARSILRPAKNFRSQAVSGTVNLQLPSAESLPSAQAISLSQALQSFSDELSVVQTALSLVTLRRPKAEPISMVHQPFSNCLDSNYDDSDSDTR